MSDLAKCPFCGSDETVICECEDTTAGCSTFWVECDACSAKGPVSEYKEGAALYWNKAMRNSIAPSTGK